MPLRSASPVRWRFFPVITIYRFLGCAGTPSRLAPAELLVKGVRLLLLNSHWCGHAAGRLGRNQPLGWSNDSRTQDLITNRWWWHCTIHRCPSVILCSMAEFIDQEPCVSSWCRSIACDGGVRPHPSALAGQLVRASGGPFAGQPFHASACNTLAPSVDRALDPGGRLLEIDPTGDLRHRVLRWSTL